MRALRTIVVSLTCFMFLLIAVTAAAENPYATKRLVLPDGKIIIGASTPLPPPPVLAPVAVPSDDPDRAPVLLPNVPAFDWCYGCAATSGAMLAGFYDNNGYANMYAGPTNGGTCPMTNAVWGSGHCPLSATEQGYDGLGVRGHVDDYWISYQSSAPDPYITGAWTQHTHANCTGDFMGTNQSAVPYENTDGSTSIYYYPSGAPYSGANADDGGWGLKLFCESRGYTVEGHFTQLIYGWDGNTGGMTFTEYKAEIDAGRPVLIHVEGHTMLGFGYDVVGSLIYLHDTWDYSDHTMAWGGWYPYGQNQLHHWGVTCIELADTVSIFADSFESGSTSRWSSTTQ